MSKLFQKTILPFVSVSFKSFFPDSISGGNLYLMLFVSSEMIFFKNYGNVNVVSGLTKQMYTLNISKKSVKHTDSHGVYELKYKESVM